MNVEKCHLVSWNVNGLKKTNSLIKKHNDSLSTFLKKLEIDIMCLQETKTNYGEIENNLSSLGGVLEEYESYWCCCENKNREKVEGNIPNHNKGYSGVATFVNKKFQVVCATNNPFKDFYSSINSLHFISKASMLIKRTFSIDKSSISFYLINESLEQKKEDLSLQKGKADKLFTDSCRINQFFNEGRVLITYHKNFVIVNIYAPYSGCNFYRLKYKMLFLHSLRAKLIQIRLTTGLPIVLMGDFNIQYRNKDVHYTNNIINLNTLEKNIYKIKCNEKLKREIAAALPIIIKTLKDKKSFIIKRKQVNGKDYFYLFLKFEKVTKQIGSSFESKEEIEYFFSLDAFVLKSNEVLKKGGDNRSKEWETDKEEMGIKKKKEDVVADSKTKAYKQCETNKKDEIVDRFYFILDNPLNKLNTIFKEKEEKYPNSVESPRRNDVDNHSKNEHKNNINSFSESVEREMNTYFSSNKENIKYNENLKEKIISCPKIICKYKFDNSFEDGYILKKENCIYLKHLNDLLIALGINLNEEILLDISNSIGVSSSPECCVRFLNSLLKEDNMVDTFSYFYPNINGKFSCWDVYKQNRVTNVGSRIDYILVDYVLVEQFIKEHAHLYKSPVVITEQLKRFFLPVTKSDTLLNNLVKDTTDINEKDTDKKSEKEIIGTYESSANKMGKETGKETGKEEDSVNEQDSERQNNVSKDEEKFLSYDSINSYENNKNYATYFGKIKKKFKNSFPEEDADFIDDEMYKLQFQFLSYIGFIYTSPKLSDHIAVNCTFLQKKKKTYDDESVPSRNQPICCSNFSIALHSICNSLSQYVCFMPFFLIYAPFFLNYFCTLTNHTHLYTSTCSALSETQPHKKTNKITDFFFKKNRKS